jgi:hypothetical protein
LKRKRRVALLDSAIEAEIRGHSIRYKGDLSTPDRGDDPHGLEEPQTPQSSETPLTRRQERRYRRDRRPRSQGAHRGTEAAKNVGTSRSVLIHVRVAVQLKKRG